VQALFHLQQTLALLGRQLGDRHARQFRDDLRHVLHPDFGRVGAARLVPFAVLLVVLLLPRTELALELLGAVEVLARRGVIALPLELLELGLALLQLGRPAGTAQPHARRRLVDQVDRLVREVPPADVAVRHLGRRHVRLVRDGHLVVRLEAVPKPPQDDDRLLDGRLGDDDRLEPPLQGRIFLDVLLVLVECGRANEVQLAARELRLERVRDVQPALAAAAARPDDRV
jgi:hypothetical protein